MPMFKALLHHLGRAVDTKGRELFADGDCRAETAAEVEELEERLARLEAKIEELEAEDKRIEEKVDQPDWRERR